MGTAVSLEGREILRPLIPYQAELKCAVAQCDGRMQYTGEAQLSSPPKYVHSCTVCTARETFKFAYPGTVFRLAPEA